jgi:hypothetical protein
MSQTMEYQSKSSNDYKMHSANVHDPILTAVNEQQPFEQANNNSRDARRPSYLSQESNDLKDIFGNSIRQGDMSNPTRSRNERPLDTIRGFEYAITGDLSYRDQLETLRLGWGFHDDFSYYNLGNRANGEVSRPTATFSSPNGDQAIYQAGNYLASSLRPEVKKKRGLFGRKKK